MLNHIFIKKTCIFFYIITQILQTIIHEPTYLKILSKLMVNHVFIKKTCILFFYRIRPEIVLICQQAAFRMCCLSAQKQSILLNIRDCTHTNVLFMQFTSIKKTFVFIARWWFSTSNQDGFKHSLEVFYIWLQTWDFSLIWEFLFIVDNSRIDFDIKLLPSQKANMYRRD